MSAVSTFSTLTFRITDAHCCVIDVYGGSFPLFKYYSTSLNLGIDSTCGQRALYALGMTQIPIVRLYACRSLMRADLLPDQCEQVWL